MSFKLHSHELALPLHPQLSITFMHHAHSGDRVLVLCSFSCHFWLLPWICCSLAVMQGEEWCFILDSSLAKSTHIFLSFPKSVLFFSPKLQIYLRFWSFLSWVMAAFPVPEFPLQHHVPHPHPSDPSALLPASRSSLPPSPFPLHEGPEWPCSLYPLLLGSPWSFLGWGRGLILMT